MGLLRSALLLGAGAAVGYFASRRAASEPAQRTPGSALLMREHGELALNPESQMGKFFDSPIGKPLQPYALRAVEFAARVREGMQEKEMELNAKVERQKQDLRPGSLDTWDRQNILTADEILHIMGTRHTLAPAQREDPHSPAGRWIVDGDPTKRLGVIASVSDPFCNACDRTRLTSDGMVRSCLFSTEETSLRDLLRGGGSDAQIAARWADAMWVKPAAHGLNTDAFARPSRTMSRIGG